MKTIIVSLFLLTFFSCQKNISITDRSACTIESSKKIVEENFYRKKYRRKLKYKIEVEENNSLYKINILPDVLGWQDGGGAYYEVSKNNCEIVRKLLYQWLISNWDVLCNVVAHELQHFNQQQDNGFANFYIKILFQYIKHGYDNAPFEVDANQFVESLVGPRRILK